MELKLKHTIDYVADAAIDLLYETVIHDLVELFKEKNKDEKITNIDIYFEEMYGVLISNEFDLTMDFKYENEFESVTIDIDRNYTFEEVVDKLLIEVGEIVG